MKNLPSSLFTRACRIFLERAYPAGTVPEGRQTFLHLRPDDPVEPLLHPPMCEVLIGTETDPRAFRGYAFRLGSQVFPHVKLQVIWYDEINNWLFAVDTHDAIHLPPTDPDYRRFHELQAKNRRLKQQIEQAWEAAGLLTFNAILRQALGT